MNVERGTGDEALDILVNSKESSDWSRKTNVYAVDCVKYLIKCYGDVWQKGTLSEDQLFSIVLPDHAHRQTKIEERHIVFDRGTTVAGAVDLYFQQRSKFPLACKSHIAALRDAIMKEGFTSTVLLAVKDEKLCHIDGLHRLVAIGSLIREGYKPSSIPVLICNP